MQETKALISAMTGEARGGSRAAAPGCSFSRGRTARSGSLSWGAREVGSPCEWRGGARDRKSTRLNSSHHSISYAVFCLKKKKINRPDGHSDNQTAAKDSRAGRATHA